MGRNVDGPGGFARSRELLQPAYQQSALDEQGGHLGDIGERGVRHGEKTSSLSEHLCCRRYKCRAADDDDGGKAAS